MKYIKLIVIAGILAALAFCFSGCFVSKPVEPQPETVNLNYYIPEGAVVSAGELSVSYESGEPVPVGSFSLYCIGLELEKGHEPAVVKRNDAEQSLLQIGENEFLAYTAMNAKETETLRDKAAAAVCRHGYDAKSCNVSEPVMLADRYVFLEAKAGAAAFSMVLYLDDDGNWTEEYFAENAILSLPTDTFVSYYDPQTKINDKTPYSIDVNRLQNCVTVYALDDQGEYTFPVKAFICSAGREGHDSPLGDYSIYEYNPLWTLMFDGNYGQYASRWRKGGYLFHSVCYKGKNKDALLLEEYNDLGNVASLGCIRLQTIDAKWIYENCCIGTPVRIYEDENPGPLGKPASLAGHIEETVNNGWDPTDPSPDNPWRTKF